MALHVKARDLARWEALADTAGLVPEMLVNVGIATASEAPRRRRKRQKRTAAQLRADLERAIDRAPSDLARRVLGRALGRMDEAGGK